MAKKFKYSHLYSTSSTTSPSVNNMVAGEIALGLTPNNEKLWASDGTNVIDLGAAIAKTSSVKIVSAVTSSTNVMEEWKLVNADNTDITGSEHIKIYKDSSLVNFYLGTTGDLLSGTTSQTDESDYSNVVEGTGDTALGYVVQLANRKYKLTTVDVESFLEESEFKSGVTVDSGTHIVHGVVDSNSETDSQTTPAPFLTVGEGGFKISGIKGEIDRKIQALDASVTGGTTAGTATSDHIQVVVGEANGVLTAVTVNEANIADADDLADEIAARKAVDGQNGNTYSPNTGTNYISAASSLNDADVKLDTAVKAANDGVDAINAKLGDGITSANTATAQLAALSGTPSDTFAATSVNGAKAYAKDYTDNAISGLDATVGSTSVETGKHVAVQVVETDGVLTAVNVTEANIADASALSALSAKTVTVIGSSNSSISASSSAKTDGTVEYDIQTDASKIKLTGYTSGATDLFAITSANTVTEAFQAIENTLYEDDGTYIIFSNKATGDTVTLSAGTF